MNSLAQSHDCSCFESWVIQVLLAIARLFTITKNKKKSNVVTCEKNILNYASRRVSTSSTISGHPS